jgi:putative drug exporter of the RND superfamily
MLRTGTFMALGSLPIVLATEIGSVMAFGVLLDTFVVRSVLISALNLDVGRWLWWPSALHRRPDLDLDQLEDDQPAALTG